MDNPRTWLINLNAPDEPIKGPMRVCSIRDFEALKADRDRLLVALESLKRVRLKATAYAFNPDDGEDKINGLVSFQAFDIISKALEAVASRSPKPLESES